jgi:5-formyltetrahydrofolate cyclo-ligase
MDIRAEKGHLRCLISAQATKQDHETKTKNDEAICHRFFALELLTCISTLCVYLSRAEEVSTDTVVARLLTTHRVVIPKVQANHQLSLHAISSLDDVSLGAFAIREPHEHCPIVHPHDVELFVVPGLAFDIYGNRLGHGAGYYDQLLQGITAPKIALAHEWQIIGTIPTTKHDVPMDMVITDQRILYARS